MKKSSLFVLSLFALVLLTALCSKKGSGDTKTAPQTQSVGTPQQSPQQQTSAPATAQPPAGDKAKTGSKTTISPNAAPNQQQLDSLKMKKFKAKKQGNGGEKDKN